MLTMGVGQADAVEQSGIDIVTQLRIKCWSRSPRRDVGVFFHIGWLRKEGLSIQAQRVQNVVESTTSETEHKNLVVRADADAQRWVVISFALSAVIWARATSFPAVSRLQIGRA